LKGLGEKSIAAVFWVLIDKAGGSLINFVVTLLLARLLTPADFGLVAMVFVFFELSSVFVESGFSTALIRLKTISDLDKSTTFIFNLVAAVVLYTALFAAAPAIARFFDQPSLELIVRVMGLSMIITAFSIVQRSVLVQEIDFKTQTKIRFIAVILSGAAAILLARQGWGVWSLVVRYLLQDIADTLLIWTFKPARFALRFSWESFRRLFGFGSNILAAAVLDKFFTQVYKLLIGKLFAAATLGFYTQAGAFTNMVINTLFRTVQNVTFPVLSKIQDDREKLKDGYRKILRLSTFVIMPALVILGVLAEPVLTVLVGKKWLPSVPFLQLLCISGVTYHLSSINLNMLLVLGRSDLSLRLEFAKKMIIVSGILIGLKFGIYGLVIGEVVSSYICLAINIFYSNALLRYSFREQMADIFPSLLFSLLSGALLFVVGKITPGRFNITYLVIVSMAGGVTYLLLHLVAKSEEIRLLKDMIIPKTMKLLTKQ
jgi:teichuronic acid exporter